MGWDVEERRRQAIGVILTLVGVQEAAVSIEHGGTEQARVALRMGKSLLYLHDRPTATALSRTWQSLQHEAVSLPREINPRLVAPIGDMAEPAVLIDAANSPPMAGRLERTPGSYTRLRVTLGRVMFDVRDLGAYSSTTALFRRAADLAGDAFPHQPATAPSRYRAVEHAAREASRLFVAPSSVRRQGRETRATAPSTGRPSVRALRPAAGAER